MRVTFQSQYRDASAGIATASERLSEFQRQVSTGRRVEKGSDDPSAASRIIAERAVLAKGEQYARATDTVSSRLTVTDTVLSDIIAKLSAAQSATTAARGTTKSQAERDAAAETLIGVRTALLEDLNTSFHGTYMFAGAATKTQPFVESGGTVGAYAGSTAEVGIDITEGRAITVNFDGSSISQGSDPADIFASLDALITAVRAGDETGITTGMSALSRASDRATTAQMKLGVAMQAVESEREHLLSAKLATTERVSSIEDADMPAAITGMAQADAAYRAALGAVGTSSKLSLMDFLG